jgi:hypothetical protein
VRVRAVVAICWRKLAMMDYTREDKGAAGYEGRTGRCIDYTFMNLAVRIVAVLLAFRKASLR